MSEPESGSSERAAQGWSDASRRAPANDELWQSDPIYRSSYEATQRGMIPSLAVLHPGRYVISIALLFISVLLFGSEVAGINLVKEIADGLQGRLSQPDWAIKWVGLSSACAIYFWLIYDNRRMEFANSVLASDVRLARERAHSSLNSLEKASERLASRSEDRSADMAS